MAAANVTVPEQVAAPQHPMRDRAFQYLFAGSTLSLLGDHFYFIALPWLILQQTGSAVTMGTIMMAGAIPRAVLMLMGGAVSDRMSPRKILIITIWVRTFCVGLISVLVWLHLVQIWELYALAITFGVADAFDSPAEMAFLPAIVKSEQLVPAMSILQARTQLTGIVAPAPVGFIIRAVGLAWAFFIDALSFLFIIAALAKLPDPPPTHEEKKPFWNSIWEGIAYLGKDIPLRSLVMVAVSINFCLGGPISLGLTYLAKTKFGSPTALGIMLSCFALGGLVGSALAGIWKIRRRGIMMIVVAFVLGLLLGCLGVLNTRLTLSAALVAIGITAGVANVHIGAWIMQRIDAALRGRVSSVLMLGSIGLIPISLALAGVLIAMSLKTMFLVAGALMLVVTGVAAMHKTVRQIE